MLSPVWLFMIPQTVACQAPLSLEFFRQEYWGGSPCSSLGDFPDPGIEPRSPALQEMSLRFELPGGSLLLEFLGVCCPFNPHFWYTPCSCHLMYPYLREYTCQIYQFIPFNNHSCCACHLALRDMPVQFSRSIMSDSLRPYGLQHARPPCPSPTPRVYSNSCPSSRWCHPTISFFVIPFSSHLQSFPASGEQ